MKKWTWLVGALLLVSFVQAQETEIQVELMNGVGTGSSRKGDLVLDDGAVRALCDDGKSLLRRLPLGRGSALFCATLPDEDWSALREGTVLVPVVQRMLQAGAEVVAVVEAQTGFEVRQHWLEMFGLCPQCRTQNGA